MDWDTMTEYYALGHASRFVWPGALRIGSSEASGGVQNVAFENADGIEGVPAATAESARAFFGSLAAINAVGGNAGVSGINLAGGLTFSAPLTVRSTSTWSAPT